MDNYQTNSWSHKLLEPKAEKLALERKQEQSKNNGQRCDLAKEKC